MNKFSDKLLEKIEQDKIEPKSKSFFVLKDRIIWGIGIGSLVLGSLALSVIVSVLLNSDWDLAPQLGRSLPSFFFMVMPYLWIALLGVFILVAHYQVRHTKGGYKFSLPILILGVIGGGAILGALFYQVGLGQAVDEKLGENSHLYRQIANRKLDILTNPEEGRLAGKVIESELGALVLKDITGKEWDVDISEAILPFGHIDRGDLPEGALILATGELSGDNFFIADEIAPLIPRDKLRDHFKQMGELKEHPRGLRSR